MGSLKAFAILTVFGNALISNAYAIHEKSQRQTNFSILIEESENLLIRSALIEETAVKLHLDFSDTNLGSDEMAEVKIQLEGVRSFLKKMEQEFNPDEPSTATYAMIGRMQQMINQRKSNVVSILRKYGHSDERYLVYEVLFLTQASKDLLALVSMKFSKPLSLPGIYRACLNRVRHLMAE